MTCMVIMGRVWKKALEEFRGLPVGVFFFFFLLSSLDHTDTLTINTQKHSSKCSGVVAYGAFDFVCV